jgi:uncharacterized protein YbcI
MADVPEDGDEHGQSLLARISNEMVRSQKQFFGKGPTEAKSYLLDDLLVIVMRGGLTTAEKTMLEFGQPDQVRQFRQLFENEMTERLTDMIERLTGRRCSPTSHRSCSTQISSSRCSSSTRPATPKIAPRPLQARRRTARSARRPTKTRLTVPPPPGSSAAASATSIAGSRSFPRLWRATLEDRRAAARCSTPGSVTS